MLKLKKIAVTGTLSSGKTTVCNYLKELGAFVVSADEIVHQLLSPQSSTGQKIIELLGNRVVQQNSFNRKKIGKIVFNNDRNLKSLEEIIFPEVEKEIAELYKQACDRGGYTSFVAEVPLLYEAKMEKQFDAIIAVIADEAVCLNRYLASGGTKDQFTKRMQKQLSSQKKLEMAPFHLINHGDLEQLKRETAVLYQQLI